ncbi:MAG TPA: class I SAM-dependent methyltransferase [Steroidobacteraceae bacterium]|nr:class I SAM-dependent methyltransferase [Steroidobacteraceae bacterium]
MTAMLQPDRSKADARALLSRQSFVAALRGYVLDDLAAAMRHAYESEIEPAFERTHERPPRTQDEVHAAMQQSAAFKLYSSIRVNAQEMVWRSVIPAAQTDLAGPEHAAADTTAAHLGSLTLDPALALPANVAGIEVHLMPGGYAPDASALAGAIYDRGLAVFAAGMMGRNQDDIGLSMAHYVKYRFADFRPRRILDCGATVGHNSVPWAVTFPDAEVHAIDVSAAVLAYGHHRAQALGVPVHFRQMDATRLAYPDASFDVVFSSMFLHELPVADIERFFTEARRVLRPGGLLLNMELPPNRELAPYDQFYLDWDRYYNEEPYYRAYRDQAPEELVAAGGFTRGSYFQFVVPQYSYMPDREFAAAVCAPPAIGQQTGRLSSGVQWFGFGAWNRP